MISPVQVRRICAHKTIALVALHPGLKLEQLERQLAPPTEAAVVVGGAGCGDPRILEAIRRRSEVIPVVSPDACLGMIDGRGMTAEAALAKLTLVLSSKTSLEDKRLEMEASWAGEGGE